jgi:hypothetical protein
MKKVQTRRQKMGNVMSRVSENDRTGGGAGACERQVAKELRAARRSVARQASVTSLTCSLVNNAGMVRGREHIGGKTVRIHLC